MACELGLNLGVQSMDNYLVAQNGPSRTRIVELLSPVKLEENDVHGLLNLFYRLHE